MLNHWLGELHRRVTTANRRARPLRRARFRPAVDALEERATPAALTFQQGVGGYTAYLDSQIREVQPNDVLTDNPGNPGQIRVDGEDGGGVVYGLLRFNNIFGTGTGQIPLGSTINSATLRFDLAEDGINSIFHFHRMVMDWSDTNATWNFFGGNGVSLDGVEAVATPDFTVGNSTTTIPVGAWTIDVLPSLRAWSGGAVNRGWYFRPDSAVDPFTDGILFRSAEDTTANLRPLLTVDYTPSAVAAPRVASTQIN